MILLPDMNKNIEKSKYIRMLDFPHVLTSQETFRVISNKMTNHLITFHSKNVCRVVKNLRVNSFLIKIINYPVFFSQRNLKNKKKIL